MPEAPEVSVVLDSLASKLEGLIIEKVTVTHPKLSATMPCEEFEAKLEGQSFESFFRIGKYLGFVLTDYDLIIHLRMEGKLFVYDSVPEEEKVKKHIHAVFALSNGKYLCYQDTRKFGRMYLYDKVSDPSKLSVFDKIGPDVLDERFTAEYLHEKTRKRKAAIKTVLLDQSVASGIGNIYADEILFAAKLDPRSISSNLTLEDCALIVSNTKMIIKEAIKAKGTTIRSFAYAHEGKGSFQDKLKVHRKKDVPCIACSEPIIQVKVGQRSTYLCPSCQIRK